MGEAGAVRHALDLMHVPSRVRLVRSEPLPSGVEILLRIAAGDAQTLENATEMTGRQPGEIEGAAGFFIEQILLSPDSDSYRVLGVNAQATAGELRRNMALLMQWLHPDKNSTGDRSIFATRITRAWENLKTEERRAAYDSNRRVATPKNSGGKNGASRTGRSGSEGRPSGRRRPAVYPERRGGLLRRVLRSLFGARD